jgi:hypothetical protein
VFFAIEKKGYIITQCILVFAVILLRLSPESWLTSDAATAATDFIHERWPKIAYDANVIGMTDGLRATRYVLASGFSVGLTILSTLILLVLLARLGCKGTPPYYINWTNLFLFPFVILFLVYAVLIDTTIAEASLERFSYNAKGMVRSDFFMLLSACGIGMVGTGIVRGSVLYLRLILDGGDFPAKE